MEAKPARIALFGGSFDPVHLGHLAIARAAVVQADLDKVIFLPAAQSPLKSRGPVADGKLRMAMLDTAVAGLPWASTCDWELSSPGPSYSWRTAEHFARSGKVLTEWFWLMGEDQWEALEHWSRWEFLASMVVFLVFGRDGGLPRPRRGIRAQFLSGQFKGSSTEVRARIASGREIEGLVPDGVATLIHENGLYLPPGDPKPAPATRGSEDEPGST